MTDIQIIYDGPIVKRAEAKELGLTLYFTGNPCKHGHVDQRWTCSARCKICQKISTDRHYKENEEKYKKLSSEYNKKRWVENKEELSARHKEWRLDNLDKRAEYIREWWSGREDERNARQRDWNAKNPERAKKHRDNNRKNNPETIRMCIRRRRALEYNAEGNHTKEDISDILYAQNNKCVYCGDDISQNYHVDHIMPLVLGGSNWPDNLQCLCPSCNAKKGGKHPDDWHKEIGYEVAI